MTAGDPFDRDQLAALAAQYRVESTTLAEVLDRLDTALAALEDTQTALAELQLAADVSRVLVTPRRHIETARREATEALEWLEAVGRYGSRRRHPSSRRHG